MDPSRPPHTRTLLHTRAVTYRGFARSDGLWDIEGSLLDTKDYAHEGPGRSTLQPGLPIHEMLIRVTVDDTLKIVDIVTGMFATPFGECLGAAEPMRRLIGATLGKGWRKTIDAAMGGVDGCTHLRELLFNLATAAIQTIPTYMDYQRRQLGQAPSGDITVPNHLDQCLSWRRDGPTVQRIYPQFFAARPNSLPDSDHS